MITHNHCDENFSLPYEGRRASVSSEDPEAVELLHLPVQLLGQVELDGGRAREHKGEELLDLACLQTEVHLRICPNVNICDLESHIVLCMKVKHVNMTKHRYYTYRYYYQGA